MTRSPPLPGGAAPNTPRKKTMEEAMAAVYNRLYPDEAHLPPFPSVRMTAATQQSGPWPGAALQVPSDPPPMTEEQIRQRRYDHIDRAFFDDARRTGGLVHLPLDWHTDRQGYRQPTGNPTTDATLRWLHDNPESEKGRGSGGGNDGAEDGHDTSKWKEFWDEVDEARRQVEDFFSSIDLPMPPPPPGPPPLPVPPVQDWIRALRRGRLYGP